MNGAPDYGLYWDIYHVIGAAFDLTMYNKLFHLLEVYNRHFNKFVAFCHSFHNMTLAHFLQFVEDDCLRKIITSNAGFRQTCILTIIYVG